MIKTLYFLAKRNRGASHSLLNCLHYSTTILLLAILLDRLRKKGEKSRNKSQFNFIHRVWILPS